MSSSTAPQTTGPNKRASFFSHLTRPSGLPSSPRPQNRQSPENNRTSPRSSAEGWQSAAQTPLQPRSRPGPPSPSYSVQTQSSSRTASSTLSQGSTVSYVPMTYEPNSYTPVSSMPSVQGGEGTERKARGNGSTFGGVFSRFKTGKKKKKEEKVVGEEQVVEIKGHNDFMDEEY